MIGILLLIIAAGVIDAATLGDGQTSLLTGRAVNHRSSDGCVINGVNYASETSVPRQHPCHYCICYGGKVDCFWKKCGSIPQGCQVMDIEGACNPSLYVCEIPEKARHAPNYGPVVARQVVTSTPAPTSTTKTTSSRLIITNPPPTTAVRRQVATSPVVRTTTTTTTTTTAATTSKLNDITPPVRHLQPPALPETAQAAVSAASAQIKAARLVDDRSPAQFGLRMKNKMRFSRSVRRRLRQALNIQEPFPVVFDEHFVADLHRRIRQKRSILGSSADNHDHDHHHHHHDHDEPVDTGCSILGVHYLLGQVVGVATDQCQECRCAAQSLFCSPKCCFKPAPFEIVPHLMAVFEETRNHPTDDAVVQNPLYYVQSEFQ